MSKVWDYDSNKDDRLSKVIKKKGNNIVMTNPIMAKELIENHTSLKQGDIVLDCCRGEGAFYDNLPSYVEKDWCEINEGIDFLEHEGEYDVILSNPPFVPRKLFWNFHLKAMELSKRNIYWLINMSSLNVFTPKRLQECKNNKWYIEHIHIVSDRRWFGRYCWITFGRNPDNNIFTWKKKVY